MDWGEVQQIGGTKDGGCQKYAATGGRAWVKAAAGAGITVASPALVVSAHHQPI